MGDKMQKATFGAGCFWGVEAAFRALEGVEDAAVGYAGGHLDNPTYEDVCTGQTGHTEVVQVTFDPSRISFARLMETFWQCHNPTTLNRQGPDIGTQYRSAIYYHDTEQKVQAETAIKEMDDARVFPDPIVTEVTQAGTFYRAEEYHQQYLTKRNPFRF